MAAGHTFVTAASVSTPIHATPGAITAIAANIDASNSGPCVTPAGVFFSSSVGALAPSTAGSIHRSPRLNCKCNSTSMSQRTRMPTAPTMHVAMPAHCSGRICCPKKRQDPIATTTGIMINSSKAFTAVVVCTA